MSHQQFRLIIIGFGAYLGANLLVWGGFWAYLMWKGLY